MKLFNRDAVIKAESIIVKNLDCGTRVIEHSAASVVCLCTIISNLENSICRIGTILDDTDVADELHRIAVNSDNLDEINLQISIIAQVLHDVDSSICEKMENIANQIAAR